MRKFNFSTMKSKGISFRSCTDSDCGDGTWGGGGGDSCACVSTCNG